MILRSVALRTDLMLADQVEDRGDHLVVRTPDNPSFYWGNCVILRRAPRPGEIGRFADRPAIGWDGVDGDAGGPEVEAELAAAGFAVSRTITMVSSAPAAPPVPDGVELRAIDDVAAIDALFARVYPDDGEYASIRRRFLDARVRAGRGAWLGAFAGGALVAAAGLFWGDGLARFQEVGTDPAHRRRGIMGALLGRLGRAGLARGVERLVLCVGEDDPGPARLYRSLGFDPVERVAGATRR